MNTLFGLANAGLTAASAAKTAPRMNSMNNNNNNYVPFENTRKKVGNFAKNATRRVGNLAGKATLTLKGLFGKKQNTMATPVSAPAAAAAPNMGLQQYKSRMPVLKTRTRKNRPVNNLYVPSNTEAPNVNLSYVKNRNESVRNALNATMVGYNPNANKPLTNKQKAARIEVARKMARGEPVTLLEKINAGMSVTIPKPKGPKPPGAMAPVPLPKGGKRSRKAHRRTVRRR